MTTDTRPAPAALDSTPSPAIPRGAPQRLLRLEGGVVLIAALVAYAQVGAQVGAGWGPFAALFLVPDLSLLGYLAGPRIGAAAYNAGHSHLGPATLAALAWMLGSPAALLVATVWVAHIGFDRMLGYGLKYGSAFCDTHLGRIGLKSPTWTRPGPARYHGAT